MPERAEARRAHAVASVRTKAALFRGHARVVEVASRGDISVPLCNRRRSHPVEIPHPSFPFMVLAPLRSSPGDVLLFGFGALLSSTKLPARQPEWCVACAPDFQFQYRHNGGFGTLVRTAAPVAAPHCSPGVALGIVVALREFELEEIKRREKGYDLLPIDVVPAQDGVFAGGRASVLAFVSSPWHLLGKPVPPRRRYVELMLSGATERGLPDEYRAWLRGELEGAKSSGASAACDCLSRLPFLRTMCRTAA